MHRHHVESLGDGRDHFCLAGEEAHHLQHVLRLKAGAVVELFDGTGATLLTRVTTVGRRMIELQAAGEVIQRAAPRCSLTLFIAICKAKRMEWAVEKAVELGVARIVPLVTERSVVNLEHEAREVKQLRWQRIAKEAARQCGTAWLPAVALPTPLAAAYDELRANRPLLVGALTSGTALLRDVLHEYAGHVPRNAGWVVGPEGDLTAAELELLCSVGGICCSLGQNVLRSETAALYGLAVLGALWL